MMDCKDPGFMEAFKACDKAADRLLFNEYNGRLVYYCLRMIDDVEQAKDIACECITKIFLRRNDFDTVQEIASFLYISARNHCLNVLRYNIRQQQRVVTFMNTLPENRLIDEELINAQIEGELLHKLSSSLNQLPDRSRQVIHLLYVRQLSYQQIADLLQISTNTVANIRSYALKNLRQNLRGQGITQAIIFLLIFISGNI